jgi:hypothetical protein
VQKKKKKRGEESIAGAGGDNSFFFLVESHASRPEKSRCRPLPQLGNALGAPLGLSTQALDSRPGRPHLSSSSSSYSSSVRRRLV